MNKELLKTKNVRIVIWIALIIVIVLFFWLTAPRSASKVTTVVNVNNELRPATNSNAGGTVVNGNVNAPKPRTGAPWKKPAPKPVGFTEKKTPHFVSATIANNATLTQAPTSLTLNFDALILKTQQSFVTVKKNDINSETVNTSSVDGKTLFVRLNPSTADGDYYVYYVACFADTGCSDGRFGYRLKLP